MFKRKHLLAILILLTGLSINAQQIYYTHQNKSLERITTSEIEWKKYTEPIYNGTNNGVYWFKIELQKNTPQILSIPESHISRANLYHENKEINRKHNTRYITFKIDNKKQTKTTYYLKVNCLLEARIPINIDDYSTFYKSEIKDYMHIGIYTGIVLSIILLNFLSYITLKNSIYLYYIFMVIGMTLNVFYKDGITALFFGLQSFNETHETSFNSVLQISGIFFTTKYLSLKKRLPKLRKVAIIITVIAMIVKCIYHITSNFIFFVIVDILFLAVLDVLWFSGILLWNKYKDARFLTIAYGISLFFAHDYYISPNIGIYFLDPPLGLYKIGSIFEMLVFTVAIMYQSKRLAQENKVIRQKIIDYTNELKNQNFDINKPTTPTDELIEQYSFTIREIDVLKKVSDNKTNKQIASELFISENTVKFHIRNILQKLEVKNRKAASNKYLTFLKTQ